LFHRWRNQKIKSLSLPFPVREFPKVSYGNIFRATEGFSPSKLIGRGRYSYVYVARLFQDKIVAVKVFILVTRGAQKSFIIECNALRNLRHRNLVPIITACSSIDSSGNDFKALIYEFMPRGDLREPLYSTRDDASSLSFNDITLAQRINIVVDVADALEYLHHNNQGTVVHCDLKPSNILLDENMTVHIGDFGLARFRVDETILISQCFRIYFFSGNKGNDWICCTW
jgi:serine/threonine protein kinase